MNKPIDSHCSFIICLILAAATVAVFWPVHNYDFVNFDDHLYVAENAHVLAGLTRDSLIWAFTTVHCSNWHPLTWLSHMTDCQLFGLNPGWHHLTNVLFHIANTLLLFAVFRRMTGKLWQSAFIAAAFAIHPLHVESVAWISERKDVLSTFFGMLTLICYVRYTERPAARWYILTLLIFALGLMAKPMLVTLPFVLLLLDYWPLERFGQKPFYHLIWEKIPFFLLSVISSAITFSVQKSTGAVSTTNMISMSSRFANAIVSYVGYIAKLFAPSHLAVFYPYPRSELPHWQVIAAAILITGITVTVVRFSYKYKYLALGWFWYLGTLVPVIGLVQVGMQASADRYTYVPLIGLFVVIAFGCSEILTGWKYGRVMLTVTSLIVLTVWCVCTSLQLRCWRDNVSLSEHTLQVTKDNYLAHNMLAYSLYKQGRIDESIAQNYEALKIQPTFAAVQNGLGLAFLEKNKLDEAITYFNQAIQIKPDFADAYSNLGYALFLQRKLPQAISQLTKAVALNPESAKMRTRLAQALMADGRVGDAVKQLRILAQSTTDWTALNNLAWILAVYKDTEFYDPSQAIYLAQKACELTDYKNAGTLDTLAAAYAAAGRFPEAVSTVEKALAIAQASPRDKQLADQFKQHLDMYKNGQPCIEAVRK